MTHTDLTKEQATKYVFSQNVQQSRLLNGISRTVFIVLNALTGFLVLAIGVHQGSLGAIILGSLQIVVVISGLLFSGYEHEAVSDKKQELFIDLVVNAVQMAAFFNTVALIAIHLHDKNFEIALNVVPYLVLLLSTAIAFIIASRKNHSNSRRILTKNVSMSGIFILVVGSQIIVHLFDRSTASFFDQLSSHSLGLTLTAMICILNIFFGLIIGLNSFKAILTKQFNIDLSPFFDGSNFQDGYHLKWK
ncbi:hypothetical protein EFT43_10460 [Leuconostoc falkenbergense]|uniref:hypothetical protein n=1 Tax=Leuconostoc falkenbergense TaxID=2766470 RepID=UPI00166DD836|nr:hypothetical protein [Leuconostoc falkenbergense]MCT4405314.1 hypothetical protein [Leuconostoc falkenbergense]